MKLEKFVKTEKIDKSKDKEKKKFKENNTIVLINFWNGILTIAVMIVFFYI